MGVGDHQLHAAQAAPGERAEKLEPKGLRLGGADGHAEHFAPAVAVHAHSDGHRDGHGATSLADLHIGGVEPEIWPITFDGAVEEILHPLVDLSAKPADLALGDALHAHGADQVVHRTC